MKVKAYAKINLMLRVIRKKENNYHELQMVNTKIDLYDIVKIKESKKNKIVFKKNHNISPDFIIKVINKFNSVYNIEKKYLIKIVKNIPVGSGLGGGSADAAAIINALYKYNNIEENMENKIRHFKELGADIPYMFFETPAVVEGIGEIITPLEPIDLSRFIVVYPEIEVITKKVFENNSKYSEKLSLEEIKRHVGIDADIYENDLEQTTSKLFYKWGVIKRALSKYGKVWMSGSGSCLVIYINGERKNIIKEIKKTLPNVRVL